MRISKEGLGLGNHLIVFEASLIPNHHYYLLPTLSSPLSSQPPGALLTPSTSESDIRLFFHFNSNTLIFEYLRSA
jgi:hypothetical protein